MNKEIVWVTGAGSGIGREIALAFALNGHSVLATGRSLEKLQNLELNGGGHINIAQCDMSSNKSISSFFEQKPESKDISILVNNAGITSFTPAENDSPELIEKVKAVNLTGAIHAIQSVLPGMISRKNGIILNILSVITQKVFTKSSIYSATKSGLEAYSKVLREEVRRHNIKVINVSPGATNTPIWSEEMRGRYAARMMNPKELAGLVYNVCFLQGNVVAEDIVLRPVQGDL